MIQIKNIIEKNVLKEGKNEFLFLTQITGDKIKKNKKKKTVNLSLAIDISTSMSEPISNNRFHQPSLLDQMNQLNKFNNSAFNARIEPRVYQVSKLDLSKQAAIKCVEMLNDGDYLSVVVFDDKVNTIQEPVKIDSKTKIEIISKIRNLHTGGSTDLHAGWIEAASKVAQNLNSEYINRVLLISDGDTNCGIRNTDEIATRVNKVYQKSISTSCFGVGQNFNEDLLQNMTNSGGGNFYYIEKDSDFVSAFENEFNGLSNLSATEVKIKLELNNGEIIEQFNKYVKNDDVYFAPNVYKEKTNSILFKIKLKVPENLKTYEIGKLTVSYRNHDGNIVNIEEKINVDICSKKAYDKLEASDEIKVQEALMLIANTKIEMTHAIDRGDMNHVNSLMATSMSIAGSLNINDARLSNESKILNETYAKKDMFSDGDLRKHLSNQSYSTRYDR